MRPEITGASYAFHNMLNGSNRDKDYDDDISGGGAHSSGFTAVNGRTSRSPPHSAKDQSHPARAATDAPDQKPPAPARPPEPWSYQKQPQRHESQPVHAIMTRRDSDSSHKRKRSGSQEAEANRSATFPANGPRRRPEGFPSPENEQYSDNSEEGYPASATTSPTAKPHPPSGANGESSTWQSRTGGPNVGPPNAHARPYHGESERHHSPGYKNADQSGPSAVHDPEGSSHETTRAGVQVDPKKRKRQFANRTKTGCATCRRRKKKCDEHKPECNNCTRGGFVCEGYTSKTTWTTKSDTSRGPVNIISKEEGAPTAMYGRFPSQPPRDFHEPPPPHPPHPDGARPRPIVVDEVDRRASRGPWPAPWPSNNNEPPPPPRQQYPPPPQHEYGPPPSHGPPRGYHEQQQQPPPPPHRHSSSSAYPSPAGPGPNQPSHSSHGNHAATAQLALQHSSHGSHQSPMPPPPMNVKSYHQQHGPPQGPPPEPPTEKQKMLKGERHLLMDPELVRERDACKEVLWRYNNAMSPVTKATREARDSLFREILHAAWVPRVNSQSTPVGSAGRNITVEAPFTCDYGYNIHLGDNVLIGQNCTILDSVKVTIGANTIIGPNVSIYAGTASSDGHRRVTEKGLCGYGKEVRIEEDCFIGGNVIIMAGCSIGKGSTVGAGSVVRENVPPHTVNTGNPTKVSRGIFPGR